MGMTIEEAIEELESTKDYPASDPASDEALDFAIDIMRKYQMFQTKYVERLKADLKAILVELQLEIEELENPLDYDFEGYNQCAVDCEKLIQQKIDKLKED